MDNKNLKEITYYVKGMHCVSCEVLIERKLLEFPNIKFVDVSLAKGEVKVFFEGEELSVSKINEKFKKEGYFFSKESFEKKENNFLVALGTVFLVFIIFLLLKNSKFTNLVNVNSDSSLPTFFFLGLIAGLSSCVALIGGLVLSCSKQWLDVYSKNNSFFEKLKPHLLFNISRILSYGFFGGLVGLIGKKIQLSLGFSFFLTFFVSVLMLGLGLQMLGFKSFKKFQLKLPKFIVKKIVDENKLQGKYVPILLGIISFFLPCGFTLTAQGLALISGSFLKGALIMIFFALGTTPGLLAIGFSVIKFLEKPYLSNQFLKVAGVLVLFFAFYNINSQLNVLNLPSLNDINLKKIYSTKNLKKSYDYFSYRKDSDNLNVELPPIINGKQIIKMEASAFGYNPNYFRVRVGIPVLWEIKDVGVSGCTNAIIARGLFSDVVSLVLNQVTVKEFIPKQKGKYKFSCWMGMVSGIIEVVN